MLDVVVSLEVKQCLGNLSGKVGGINLDGGDVRRSVERFGLPRSQDEDVVIVLGALIEKLEVELSGDLRERVAERGRQPESNDSWCVLLARLGRPEFERHGYRTPSPSW